MTIDKKYNQIIKVIQEQELVSIEVEKYMNKGLVKYFIRHPIQFITFLIEGLFSTKHRPFVLPQELETLVKKSLPDSLIATGMTETYFAKDFDLTLAYVIKDKVPDVNFSSLLELHQYRNPKKSIFTNLKFISLFSGFLLSIYLRNDLVILKKLTVNIPYDDIPNEIFMMFWTVIAIVLFINLIIFLMKFNRYENFTLVTAFKVFTVGKIIENYEKNKKPT